MRFSSFIYLVGQGLHNLRANRLMTFASMGVLTVCMLLIGAASLLGVNIDHMVEYIGNQNLTVVYMGGTGESEGATDEQIAAAGHPQHTPRCERDLYVAGGRSGDLQRYAEGLHKPAAGLCQ